MKEHYRPAYKGGKWVVINWKGKVIVECKSQASAVLLAMEKNETHAG